MKKAILMTLGVMLLSLTTLNAYTKPCAGEFGLAAEWLYMLSAYDQPYFVIDSRDPPGESPVGERKANEQDWQSGYRIEALYAFCNGMNDVRLRWTHFPSFSEEKGVTGAHLFGVFIPPDEARTNFSGTVRLTDTFDFYFFDLLFGQSILSCGPFDLEFLGGLQYGYLDLREKMTYLDYVLTSHSQLWGIGPEIGYEFSYGLTQCFTLTGRGNVTLLISEREASFQDSDTELAVCNASYWTMIPTTDLRFGVHFVREFDLGCLPVFNCFCGCINLDFEIGYEVISYFNGVERIFFVDDVTEGSSMDELMNFTLHGPYFHLGFTF